MNIRKAYALIAVIGLSAATLACGSSTFAPDATSAPAAIASGPTASNLYMSTGLTRKNQTTMFLPTDIFYFNLTVNGINADTKLEARWYGSDISGQDPNMPFKIATFTGAKLNLFGEGAADMFFNLTPPTKGWSAGYYKVEAYINATKVGEQQFSVIWLPWNF